MHNLTVFYTFWLWKQRERSKVEFETYALSANTNRKYIPECWFLIVIKIKFIMDFRFYNLDTTTRFELFKHSINPCRMRFLWYPIWFAYIMHTTHYVKSTEYEEYVLFKHWVRRFSADCGLSTKKSADCSLITKKFRLEFKYEENVPFGIKYEDSRT